MILTRGEFDVQFADVLSAAERLCEERSRDHQLAGARRTLITMQERFRKGDKLNQKDRQDVTKATEYLWRITRGDDPFHEKLQDVSDFIDDNLMAK